MATSNTPYLRDGTTNAWNKLVRDINEKALDCPDLTPLEEVEECHRFAKSDIRAAQDLLKEICPDNEFSDIENLWLTRIIQELEDAVAGETCCCEQIDKVFPDLFLNYRIFFSFGSAPNDGQTGWETYDWAGWITQTTEPLVVTEIDCGEDPPVEDRQGGRGWVGKEFDTWELFLFYPDDPNPSHSTTPLITGDVIDGYIQIPEGNPKFLNACGEPENSGTPLGENDSAWNFPFEVQFVGGQWLITSLNSSFSFGPVPSSFFRNKHGFLGTGINSDPIVIESYETSFVEGFLRLKCPT